MTDEQIAAVCGQAVVHLYPADTARKEVLADCTGVEHGTLLDDATLQLGEVDAVSWSAVCHEVRCAGGDQKQRRQDKPPLPTEEIERRVTK
jgi:hypothetical protein